MLTVCNNSPNRAEVKHSLRRQGLAPEGTTVRIRTRRDKYVEALVTGLQRINGLTVLQALFEIGPGGRVRLAYDHMTGELIKT